MTKTETIQIITAIKLAYPTFMEKIEDDTFTSMVEFWYKYFENDSYRLVEIALQKHISTNKWAPSIAEIREQMAKLMHPDLIPPDVAWSVVKDYIYLRDCYVKLPPLIAKVIETIGTSTLKEQHGGHDKQMFMDLYTPAYERELEKAKMPKALSARIAKSDEAFGGDALKAIASISEAKEKERKRIDEIYYRHYAGLGSLPQSEETGN